MIKKLMVFLGPLFLGVSLVGRQTTSFSPDEYEFWKERIKATSQEAYAKLSTCEKDYEHQLATGKHPVPCMVKGGGSAVDFVLPRKESNGYPILVLPDPTKYCNDPRFAPFLERYGSINRIQPITKRDILYIMGIVQQLAPALYAELKRVDPEGSGHVARLYEYEPNVRVEVSKEDNLPHFLVTPEFLRGMSSKKQLDTLRKELSRYLNEIRGKRVAKKLQVKRTFKLSFDRNQEYEADRFAVLDLPFVIDIDDALASMKRIYKNTSREPETFESTHPLEQARINYLNDELRREAELQKNRPRKIIDWQQLAQDYLEFWKQFQTNP